MPAMLACLDVHYQAVNAAAAAVIFEEWSSPAPVQSYIARIQVTAGYQTGQFYRRELAPLLAVIARIQEPIEIFMIDAYCDLSATGAPGLGRFLFQALEGNSAVVGVAKSRYRQTTHAAEVFRGGSRRPLYVTALGLDQAQAAASIAAMQGQHRIPDLIKAADRLARSAAASGSGLQVDDD